MNVQDLLGLGLESKEFSTLQVCARAVVIFFYSIFLVRLADKRFLAGKSALDVVLGFVLASMLARTINGSAPLGPSLIAGAVVVLLHRLIAHFALRWHLIGHLVKGTTDIVIQDGTVLSENLRKNDFSQADLLEDLRLNGVETPEEVRLAQIERNGKISVMKKA